MVTAPVRGATRHASSPGTSVTCDARATRGGPAGGWTLGDEHVEPAEQAGGPRRARATPSQSAEGIAPSDPVAAQVASPAPPSRGEHRAADGGAPGHRQPSQREPGADTGRDHLEGDEGERHRGANVSAGGTPARQRQHATRRWRRRRREEPAVEQEQAPLAQVARDAGRREQADAEATSAAGRSSPTPPAWGQPKRTPISAASGRAPSATAPQPSGARAAATAPRRGRRRRRRRRRRARPRCDGGRAVDDRGAPVTTSPRRA